jgi:hypothetical protein
MLASQYSLRRLLGLVTVSGFCCLIVATGMHGHLLAAGLAVALFGLAVAMFVYGVLFALLSCLGWARNRRKPSPTARVLS